MIEYEFFKYIPEILKPNKLYISLEYGACLHKCLCGCGREVSTPLNNEWQNGWKLMFDNEQKVTLSPSVSNWQFPCRSHYSIIGGEVVWYDN